MTEMLACWLLQCTNPTWEAVVEALDQMKECRVAAEIRKKYITTLDPLNVVACKRSRPIVMM